MDLNKFEDIRPYNDEEVPGIIQKLLNEPIFRSVLSSVFPDLPAMVLEDFLKGILSKDEFQTKVSYEVLRGIAKRTTVNLDCSGLDHLSKEISYTFISNHRDIVLDAAWLNVLLFANNFPTTEVAIGDNLFVLDWIREITRLNKSFIVKRGLTGRQMLESSAILSSYMHYAITKKNTSIWVAQREGRSKDSDDHTQESLLKMLIMGGNGTVIESLKELNIVPLALSYEYDPCDYLKAKEFQMKRDNEDFKKSQKEDYLSMKTGIMGFKGRVHFRAAHSINSFLDSLEEEMPKSEKITAIAEYIDKQIHHNYHIYPCNYIAYDLLYGMKRFETFYSEKEETNFKNYISGQLDKIEIENKDIAFLRKKILEMYSNPLKNKLLADNINL